MGYTHYWTQTRDHTASEWAGIQHAATAITNLARAEGVALETDIGETYLALNGVDDEAHEEFVLTFMKSGNPEFCKTARKPYDDVVVAMLCYMNTLDGAYAISSDGRLHDFADGLALARRAFPFLAGVLAVPAGVVL